MWGSRERTGRSHMQKTAAESDATQTRSDASLSHAPFVLGLFRLHRLESRDPLRSPLALAPTALWKVLSSRCQHDYFPRHVSPNGSERDMETEIDQKRRSTRFFSFLHSRRPLVVDVDLICLDSVTVSLTFFRHLDHF